MTPWDEVAAHSDMICETHDVVSTRAISSVHPEALGFQLRGIRRTGWGLAGEPGEAGEAAGADHGTQMDTGFSGDTASSGYRTDSNGMEEAADFPVRPPSASAVAHQALSRQWEASICGYAVLPLRACRTAYCVRCLRSARVLRSQDGLEVVNAFLRQ